MSILNRNKHHNHKEGDVLYCRCDHIKDYREGVVKLVVPHYGMNYYVLEVETGPPINESFIKLVSEFNVRTEHDSEI